MVNKAEADSAAPLYLQVAKTLKTEILNGQYMVGSRLPTEGSLCRRFGVSRYTVREALRRLREDGLIASRQGAGTVVIPARCSSSDIHQVMSINDLLAFAEETRFQAHSIRTITVNRKLAQRTGLKEGSDWLEVKGFRYDEGVTTPVCLAEYYIYRGFASVGRLLQNYNGPIFPMIEDLFGQTIGEVHQQISAALISAELASEFKVEPGSAALEVRRTYSTSEGQVAQVTINTHPAARFQHSMTMRRLKV